MNNFIEIDIPYKSSLASYVKGFSSSFPSVRNFRCESILSNDKKETLELEINFGIHCLEYIYKEISHNIIINYEQVGNPVGTYFAAEKLEQLTIKIEYNKENYDIKKEALEQFLKDSKNYFNKKDVNEIICKILKSGYWSTYQFYPCAYMF